MTKGGSGDGESGGKSEAKSKKRPATTSEEEATAEKKGGEDEPSVEAASAASKAADAVTSASASSAAAPNPDGLSGGGEKGGGGAVGSNKGVGVGSTSPAAAGPVHVPVPSSPSSARVAKDAKDAAAVSGSGPGAVPPGGVTNVAPAAAKNSNSPARSTGAAAAAAATAVTAVDPPQPPSPGGGLNNKRRHLSEKKLRRLEKNRLSARECRRRKREAAQQLEREINVMESENLRLRLQLQIGEEAEESQKQEQEKLTEGINALLKSGASESEIYANIEEFKEKFADYGRDRRSAIEFHLRNVERLLMPTRTTYVAMRAMEGGSGSGSAAAGGGVRAGGTGASGRRDAASAPPPAPASQAASTASHAKPGAGAGAAPQRKKQKSDGTPSSVAAGVEAVGEPSDSKKIPPTADGNAQRPAVTDTSDSKKAAINPNLATDPKRMFQFLVDYLEVTPQQAAALRDSRKVAQELDAALAQSLEMLDEIRRRLTQCGEELQMEFDNVRAILTPTQVAKFMVWIANNGACMHMLNELWSKIYPKQVGLGTDEPGNGDQSDSVTD